MIIEEKEFETPEEAIKYYDGLKLDLQQEYEGRMVDIAYWFQEEAKRIETVRRKSMAKFGLTEEPA